MPYSKSFHRLSIFGTLYSDIWNINLSIVPNALGELGMPPVDAATLAAVAGDVSTWFGKNIAQGGVGFVTPVVLTGIKVNRIGTDGLYMDEVSRTHIYPTPQAGTTAGAPVPQLTTVATFRTAISRGPASKGRIFLPPTAAILTVESDGRLLATEAQQIATGTKALLDALNARYVGIGRVGVASNVGSGRHEHVTHVTVGRVVDTMRSRRQKLDEDPQRVDLTPIVAA